MNLLLLFSWNFEIKTILKLLGNFQMNLEINLLLLFSWNFLQTFYKLWNQINLETSWKLSFTFRDKVETNFLMKHELEIKTSAWEPWPPRQPPPSRGRPTPVGTSRPTPTWNRHSKTTRTHAESPQTVHPYTFCSQKISLGLMCAGRSNVHPPKRDPFRVESYTSQIKFEQFPSEFVQRFGKHPQCLTEYPKSLY